MNCVSSYGVIAVTFILSVSYFYPISSNASTGVANPVANNPEHDSPPQPSPTPFNAECPLSIWKFQINSIWGYGNLNLHTSTPTNTSRPSCLLPELEEARNGCKVFLGTDYDFFFDNCVASYFGYYTARSRRASLISNYEIKYKKLRRSRTCTNGKCNPSGTIYLDADCKQVSKPTSLAAACDAGSYSFYFSPISLILDEHAYQKNEWTISNFSLNPHRKNDYFLWKASKSLPLLVWDPSHKGEIVSGEQLFGNWTFGGKKLASLSSAIPLKITWRDGYEALGSLDLNLDSKISGEELNPLGLWFDDNQDGISQNGEVVPAHQYGIIALYYHADYTEKGTKSIIASKGYERISDGQLIAGRSVDWYSDSAATREELILRQMAQDSLCNKAAN